MFIVDNSEYPGGMMLDFIGFKFSFKNFNVNKTFIYPSSSPLHRSMHHLEAYIDNYVLLVGLCY